MTQPYTSSLIKPAIAATKVATGLAEPTVLSHMSNPYLQSAFPPPEATLAEVIRDARLFYDKNLLLATAGNLSVRHVQEREMGSTLFWITASGLDKGNLSTDGFVLCDVNGKLALPAVAAQSALKPSAETLLHSLIYNTLPSVGAIYHTHSPAVTYLSQTLPARWNSLPLPQVEMLKALGASNHESACELAVYPNSQDMEALAETIQHSTDWEGLPGFILRGHGLYTWGRTPAEAKRHTEAVEFLAQLLLLDKANP